MAFHVSKVRLNHFRNYAEATFHLHERLTVLVGPNAAGKTNVVEAIQLLTAAESFRNPLWEDLIMWEAVTARAALEAHDESRLLSIELDVVRGKGREYRVNGSVKHRLVDVRGIIPSVAFTPDDLRMVKGAAERRRAMIDAIGQQISPAYGTLRREYDRVVRQRNAALKERGEAAVVQALTTRLVDTGSRLIAHRMRLLGRLAHEALGIHEAMSGGQRLDIAYVPSWTHGNLAAGEEVEVSSVGEAMEARLSQRWEEERRRGVTLVGPHRDDISFQVDGHDARAFSSQGQQRSVALSVKLAEVHVVRELATSPPVLLLDDVMSELDESRRHELTRFVDGWVQTVVTTTDLQYFDPLLLENATVVEVGS